jgi:hypothetical protein
MKPLLVGSRDYYSACLFRLEETRGHILSEQEYSELRKQTLDELAVQTGKPVFALAATVIAAFSGVAGVISLLSGNANPALLFGLSLATLGAGIVAALMLRKTAGAKSADERLAMLASLREHRLVTEVEFSTISERLKAA